MQHSDEQVEQIAASIREFGWTNPVLIDEAGEIIAGHGRLAAAEVLDVEDIPTITLAGLTESQKRGYRIADNKLPLNAKWDERLLRTELKDLFDEGFDLSLLAFEEMELDDLLSEEEIPIGFTKDEGNTGAEEMNWLVFCRKRVPMSEDEAIQLQDVFESFIKESGSHFGFVAHLLRGRNAEA